MDLPPIPALRSLESISPSFYNAALLCRARAAWQQFGPRGALPASTGSIIGACFHAVMEMGNQGRLPEGEEGIREAKAAFDRKASQLFSEAHPLLKAKFASPEKFPFYFERRARAATLAAKTSSGAVAHQDNAGGRATAAHGSAADQARLVEQTLSSRDGLIKGRIDLWERSSSTVTDYKSGLEPKNAPSAITANETRQLRLYVHLARENACAATAAAIVRGDGRRAVIPVSAADADSEAQSARHTLAQFNEAVRGRAHFYSLASPSRESCAGCPCLAVCDRFWEAAQPEWEESCGANAEGEIVEIWEASFAGSPLRSLSLKDCRGSAPAGDLAVEHIPLAWLSLGSSIPQAGRRVRIVSAARLPAEPQNRALRVDRVKSTAIWIAPDPRQL
jgi:PD-(D/E)XK nuclease superfamily